MESILLRFAVLVLTVYGQLMIKNCAPLSTLRNLLAQRVGLSRRDVHQYLGAKCFGCRGICGACWMLVESPPELTYAYPFMALSFGWMLIDSTLLFGNRCGEFDRSASPSSSPA